MVIGVQYEDKVVTKNLDRLFSIRGQSGVPYTIIIGPNIGNPTVNIDISLNSVLGNFFIIIDIFSDSFSTRVLYEEHTGTGSSYTNSITISPDGIPEEAMVTESFLNLEIGISEGYWSGGVIEFEFSFPMDSGYPATSTET